MDANKALVTTDRKATLSAAWIFVLLNVIFRDLHELFRLGVLAEMMTGETPFADPRPFAVERFG